jgi:hypothetical protein
VIDVLDREIQLVFVPFGIAAELAAAETALRGIFACELADAEDVFRTATRIAGLTL